MLLARFLPKENNFFELFGQLAEKIVQGAYETHEMLSYLGESEERARKLKDIEHGGDEITHRTICMLRKSFITPLDRDDMHQLVSQMDNILDVLDATAQRVHLYDIQALPAEAFALADLCKQSAEHVRSAVKGLANLKNADAVTKSCSEINRLEKEADVLFRTGVAKLFREEKDASNVIKVKEIFELLERTTDRCHTVANTVDRIVLEHA